MKKSRLLILSSDLGLTRELTRLLTQFEYETSAQATCGDDTFDLVAQQQPDLVLMDLQLDNPLDGIAELASAQTIYERLAIPVVFLTSAALDPIAGLVLQAHPYGYIRKPCDEREVRMVLTIALHQHQTELRLKRSEDRMQAMLRTSLDGFWVVDLQGRVRDLNEAACRLTGYSREELLQLNIAQLDHNRTPAEIAAGIEAIVREGVGQLERELLRKDGQVRIVEMSVTCPPGPERLLHCFGRDITDRRRTEQELVRAKEAAETASRAKSAFLAVMSHELRTPLNVVNGISATLLEQKLDPMHRQALELSLQSGQTLLTIIEEILDFSTLQAGQAKLDPEPFDLAPLLHQVLGQVAALTAARHLTITGSFDPALPARIIGDSRRLRQVLLNLLSNAVKFTERGAVHFVVRPQLGPVDRPGLHFSIVDTGIGIDEAHREIIFQPFIQADGSIKRRYGGAGLGLAISRSFVQLMGGEMRLRSRKGVGSAFHFTLPFDPLLPASAPMAEAASSRLRGESLLIAVTVGKRRRLLSALARAWGMNVTVIDPGKTTLAALSRVAPSGIALLEAGAVALNSPLRTWLDGRRQFCPLSVVWLLRPDEAMPDAAGGPVRSVPGVFEPAVLAKALAELIAGKSVCSSAVPSAIPATAVVPFIPRLPLTILAADDIQTNRQVLAMILQHLGYGHTLVENGAEVLTALQAQRYDLLLLDVQMPVMDGLTAAKEICRRYPNSKDRPKIVALTANALQGDREICLAAGMDDYLTKPLVPATLAACIKKLFSVVSQPAALPPALAPVLVADCPPLHWIDVAHLQLITQGMPEDMAAAALEQMLESASTDFEQVFPQVETACAEQNLPALHRAIHGLKGCFQMLGWTQAAACCVQALVEVRAENFSRWGLFPDELHTLYYTSRLAMVRYLAARAPLSTHTT